jgi:hypothetical protein
MGSEEAHTKDAIFPGYVRFPVVIVQKAIKETLGNHKRYSDTKYPHPQVVIVEITE